MGWSIFGSPEILPIRIRKIFRTYQRITTYVCVSSLFFFCLILRANINLAWICMRRKFHSREIHLWSIHIDQAKWLLWYVVYSTGEQMDFHATEHFCLCLYLSVSVVRAPRRSTQQQNWSSLELTMERAFCSHSFAGCNNQNHNRMKWRNKTNPNQCPSPSLECLKESAWIMEYSNSNRIKGSRADLFPKSSRFYMYVCMH